jgi:hypothetical protein
MMIDAARHVRPYALALFFFVFFFVVYVFLGDHHALIDFVRCMQARGLNSGEYVVLAVSEAPYDPDPRQKHKYFHKCTYTNDT